MGRTITISIIREWKKVLIETINNIYDYGIEHSSEPIPKSNLTDEISDDTINFYEKINILKNVAKTKTGKKSKLGQYSLVEDGKTILELSRKLINETEDQKKKNIEIRINKHLHKLLIDAYFHYEFFIKFLRYFYFNLKKNLPISKEEIFRNLLSYTIMEIGTTEIFDRHTWDDLYNMARGVDLIIEKEQDGIRLIDLNLDFFNEIDYKALNYEVENKLQNLPYGMHTIDLCKYLLEYQTRFYLGTDLTISEIYDLLKNLYIGKETSIKKKFEFLGGITYPPITSAHCMIKLIT